MKAGASKDGNCALLSTATVCRASAGPCDTEETCNGSAPNCPIDAFASLGTSCVTENSCKPVGACSGLDARCPTLPSSDACTFQPTVNQPVRYQVRSGCNSTGAHFTLWFLCLGLPFLCRRKAFQFVQLRTPEFKTLIAESWEV